MAYQVSLKKRAIKAFEKLMSPITLVSKKPYMAFPITPDPVAVNS